MSENKVIVVRMRVGEIKLSGCHWKHLGEGYQVHSIKEKTAVPGSDASPAIEFSVVGSFPINEVMGIWFEDSIVSKPESSAS